MCNFFDKVNEREMENGVKLRDGNVGGREFKQVLYADNSVLVAETREHIQDILSVFERVCDSMGLKINVRKSKVLMVEKDQMGSCEKVRVNGEEIQEVDKFNYLEVMISTDGGMGDKVPHRVPEGRKVWRTMANLWKENMTSREVKRELYEKVVIPTVVYGSETWALSAQKSRKIEVFW